MGFNFGSVLPIVGGIAGFFGSGMNPVGAMAGYQLGSAAGGMLNKDGTQQSATAPTLIQPPGTPGSPGLLGSQAAMPNVQASMALPESKSPFDAYGPKTPGAAGKAAGDSGALASQVIQEIGRQEKLKAERSRAEADTNAVNRAYMNIVEPPKINFAGGMPGSIPQLAPNFSFMGRR